MSRIAGGIAGLLITVFLYLLVGERLGRFTVGGFVSNVLSTVGLGRADTAAAVTLTVVIITAFAYLTAALFTLGLPTAVPTGAVTPGPAEGFASGLLTGLTGGTNFALWALMLPGPTGLTLGIATGVTSLLSVLTALSRTAPYKAVLGWTNWLMPYSYLATAVGLVFFLVNLPFALAAFGGGAVRLDPRTGTVETTGGLSGITGFRGGFNLGNFTFLSLGPGVGLAARPAFTVPDVPAHECGHTLNAGAFGGVVHWIGAIDENVPPLRRMRRAHTEMLAESNLPRPSPIPHLRVWS